MPAWCKELTQKNRQLHLQRPGILFYMEEIVSGLETCVVLVGGASHCGRGESAWSQWGGGCSFSGVSVLFRTGLF